MKVDWKGLLEGIKNKHLTSGAVKANIDRVSSERLAICRKCKLNSKVTPSLALAGRPDEHCTACGCNLGYKTSCLSCQCPLDPPKWEAVISLKEQEELNQSLTDEQDSTR